MTTSSPYLLTVGCVTAVSRNMPLGRESAQKRHGYCAAGGTFVLSVRERQCHLPSRTVKEHSRFSTLFIFAHRNNTRGQEDRNLTARGEYRAERRTAIVAAVRTGLGDSQCDVSPTIRGAILGEWRNVAPTMVGSVCMAHCLSPIAGCALQRNSEQTLEANTRRGIRYMTLVAGTANAGRRARLAVCPKQDPRLAGSNPASPINSPSRVAWPASAPAKSVRESENSVVPRVLARTVIPGVKASIGTMQVAGVCPCGSELPHVNFPIGGVESRHASHPCAVTGNVIRCGGDAGICHTTSSRSSVLPDGEFLL